MDLWNKVGDENEEAWASKVDKYVDEGMAEKEAKTKATEKLKSRDVKSFMKHYETLITHIRQLQNGAIHNVIMQDVDNFNQKGFGELASICMALIKSRPVLEGMWMHIHTRDSAEDDAGEEEEEKTS
jgi:hypothetical protein